MLPDKKQAEKELEIASRLNPGPWIEHCRNSGVAAQLIASRTGVLDPEKAFVLGTLHDIGRRVGIVSIPRHVLAGYEYSLEKGWDELGKICVTHTYPLMELEFAHDLNLEEKQILTIIREMQFDDYDRLIQMCDALALAGGFCLLEKRFVDVARRYGVTSTTVQRWDKVFEIKDYFEKLMGCSVYDLLPDVKETTFYPIPVWNPGKT
jgi:hypothetical protein